MQEPLAATGVILAGGKSRRMGQDKLALKIGNAAILDRVYGALASRCEEVVVIRDKGYVPAGARRIPVLRPGERPLAGIEAGLLAARHPAVFVTAGDMPFLTGDFVGYLLGLLSDRDSAVMPYFRGEPRSLCAAYRREVQPVVSAAFNRGVRSMHEVLEGFTEVRYVGEEELRRFGDPNLLLMDVDSPEDLAQARAALREGAHHGVREAVPPAVTDSLIGELRALVRLYRGGSVFPEGDAPDKTEAVVVLGTTQVLAGRRPSGTLRARARHVAQLYAKGEVGLVIFTGGVGKHSPNEAQVVGRMLRRKVGVSKEGSLIEREARSTRESARLVAAMAKERGIQSVVLVADPLHCVRAVAAFRMEGLSVRASPEYRSPLWYDPKLRREQLLREIGALLWYRIRHKAGSRVLP